MKLGLQGVTIVAASGDDGAQSTLDRYEQYKDCSAYSNIRLQVSWPASSPYVTGVGATMGIESGSKEVACQIDCVPAVGSLSCQIDPASYFVGAMNPVITSGGGYSKFAKPDYQDGHVKCEGRGVPDIALAGRRYSIVLGGNDNMFADGSSASTPVFAGMVSLVNARRKAAGKSTVGFINPAMYTAASSFNDITDGNNKCGECDRQTGVCPCCGGFEAGPGWDAVTGLGSIDFQKFETIFEPSLQQVF